MRPVTPLLAALLLLPQAAHAQVTSLKGKFVDPTNKTVVAGVLVKLTSFADTTDVHRVAAKDDGTFEVTGLGVHSYRLEASRIGYSTLRQVIRVAKQGQDAGVLQMVPEAVKIAGITVTGSPPPATQIADTTEFRADAVKTSKDATAEDLVQKLPGVTMENGKLKAHGEDVKQVLINGRPFFGSDPAAAMRNLPAEVVDRIQVYDKASDQAEFSGFDDGQQQKTMNFILRNRIARFGKVYGGYGDRDRYQAGGSATWLHGQERFTLIGLSNNINQRNFSPQDLTGALSGNGGGGGGPRIMMFGGGGGRGAGGGSQQIVRMGGGFGGGGFDPSSFLVNQQGGISTTNSAGTNYVGQWGPKLAVSGSVFVNGIDNNNQQVLTREYTPPQDSLAFYAQGTSTTNRNGNERFDARFEWTVDSLNSVIMQPRLYFQDNHTGTVGSAANTNDIGTPLSSTTGDTENHTSGDNLSNRLTLRHRFGKRGRNISADIQMGHSERDGNRNQSSLNQSLQAGVSSADTLDQQVGSASLTNSVSTRVAYTEPLFPGWQGQLIWNPQYTYSHSDARSLGIDPSGAYTILDSTQSNTFTNHNRVQNGGAAVLFTKGVWRWLTSASWQRIELESQQTFPNTLNVNDAFVSVLPSMSLTATFARRRNMRLAWTTTTSPPTISQLQNVVDNSNPLALTAGNPALHPTYSNNLTLRLAEADPLKSRSRFLFLNVSRTADPISNATFTAPHDTVVAGIPLSRGTQLTRPVNLDEASWVASAFAVYSRPLTFMKSIASLNGGASYNQTPTLGNAGTNISRTYAVRYGLVLASNISQNLDFTVSYQGNYNMARNSLTAVDTRDYYSHTLSLRLNAVAAHGVVVREEVNHNLQNGVSDQYGQNEVLWNTTLGKKFLKNDTGELRVTATDVLAQDRSVGRSFTESYVQDSRDRTLGRFVQAVFTYTFR
jgi:hypothetical protein